MADVGRGKDMPIHNHFAVVMLVIEPQFDTLLESDEMWWKKSPAYRLTIHVKACSFSQFSSPNTYSGIFTLPVWETIRL
ncbi:hypothetical protein [Pseudomonas sp. NFX15]|jgi:hypothetical protein|uniref:hypothetical protein n=1 Tax=Pseudomonas sp. NFX15 TaxID=2816958 RepID=UPI003B8D7E09